MAVVWCKEITNRSGEEDAEQNKHRVRTWQVITDAATDGVGVVLACPDIAVLYDAWQSVDADDIVTDTDLGCTAVHRSAEQNDGNDLNNWTVTVRYAGLDDPTALPADVEDDQVDYQTYLIDDVITGEPILNSAGDPFESGNPVDRSRGMLRISKNLPDGAWNSVTAEQYRDSLNATTMFAVQMPDGFTEGKLKMRSLTAKRVAYPDNQSFYWRATAVMEHNKDGWKIKNRDAGYHVLTAQGKRPPIMPGGLTPKGPILLDGSGHQLPDGGVPTVIEANGYELVDWTPLTWLDF